MPSCKVLFGESFLQSSTLEGDQIRRVGLISDLYCDKETDSVFFVGRMGGASITGSPGALQVQRTFDMPFNALLGRFERMNFCSPSAPKRQDELEAFFENESYPQTQIVPPASADSAMNLFHDRAVDYLVRPYDPLGLFPMAMLSDSGGVLWMHPRSLFAAQTAADACLLGNFLEEPGREVVTLEERLQVYSEGGALLGIFDPPPLEPAHVQHDMPWYASGPIRILANGNSPYDAFLAATGFNGRFVQRIAFENGEAESPSIRTVLDLESLQENGADFVPKQTLTLGGHPDDPSQAVVYCDEEDGLTFPKRRKRPIAVFDLDGREVARLELPSYVPGEGDISVQIIETEKLGPLFVLLVENPRVNHPAPSSLYVCDRQGRLKYFEVIHGICNGPWEAGLLLNADFVIGGNGWLKTYRISETLALGG